MPPHRKIWMTDLALTSAGALLGCGRGRQGIRAQTVGQQQPRRAAEAPAHRLAPGDPRPVV